MTKNVLGHTCEGLDKFQSRINYLGNPDDSDCIPIFDKNGKCVGCDDTNYTPIVFCPFCGVKLEVVDA